MERVRGKGRVHNLRNIVIIHPRKENVLATYFREFVKWIGFSYFDFTCNGEMEINNILVNQEQMFDIYLMIGNGSRDWDNDKAIKIQVESEEIWKDGSLRKEPLRFMWEKVYTEKHIEDDGFKQTISELIEIYCDQNLLNKLYSDKINICKADCEPELRMEHKKKIMDQYSKWLETIKKLKSYKESMNKTENSGEEYLKYAMLFCCRKMNEICRMIKKATPYDTSELISLADEIYTIDEEFYIVEELKAKIARTDSMYQLHVSFFNERCVNFCKIDLCNSFNYYRIGKYYETNGYQERATKEYKKSYQQNPLNFRALFKMAVSKINKKDFETARLYLKKILQIFQLETEPKEQSNLKQIIENLKPLELEYTVKCYFLLGQIELENYENPVSAVHYFQKIIKVQDSIGEAVKGKGWKLHFVEEMYPEEEEKWFIYSCLKSRLTIRTIEQKLKGCMGMNMYKNWERLYKIKKLNSINERI